MERETMQRVNYIPIITPTSFIDDVSHYEHELQIKSPIVTDVKWR